ncbi:unnamed protein product [Nippostrongylus brasiliensis]|uniref:Major capsid protein n=1 Tax=Nippostrongylus brasiliensis TaxID=27835 RepID=A0A0N4YJC0_NIPBR|nr:unnamed protein product [Nippostrongylus brasiliensis]
MLKTSVTLYTDRNDYEQIPAHQCYRDLIKIRAHNFLYIRTTHEIVGRERLRISPADCMEAATNKILYGHTLTHVTPGLFSTPEIDEDNTSLPLLGSTLYTRSVYSVVTETITIIDDQTIISPLGNLDNCTLSAGSCTLEDGVIVWQPIAIQPTCRLQKVDIFDALVTLRYVLIPEYELTFEFSSDFFGTYQYLKSCNITQAYLSTSNHIPEFPNIPHNVMLHDFLILIRGGNPHHRRDVKTITLANNQKSEYNLISKQPRLVPLLFNSDEIPPFDLHPIIDNRILYAIRMWNVTQHDLNRSRMYINEDTRISTLRSVRYGEYRTRQLNQFNSISKTRPLTYAESQYNKIFCGEQRTFSTTTFTKNSDDYHSDHYWTSRTHRPLLSTYHNLYLK